MSDQDNDIDDLYNGYDDTPPLHSFDDIDTRHLDDGVRDSSDNRVVYYGDLLLGNADPTSYAYSSPDSPSPFVAYDPEAHDDDDSLDSDTSSEDDRGSGDTSAAAHAVRDASARAVIQAARAQGEDHLMSDARESSSASSGSSSSSSFSTPPGLSYPYATLNPADIEALAADLLKRDNPVASGSPIPPQFPLPFVGYTSTLQSTSTPQAPRHKPRYAPARSSPLTAPPINAADLLADEVIYDTPPHRPSTSGKSISRSLPPFTEFQRRSRHDETCCDPCRETIEGIDRSVSEIARLVTTLSDYLRMKLTHIDALVTDIIDEQENTRDAVRLYGHCCEHILWEVRELHEHIHDDDSDSDHPMPHHADLASIAERAVSVRAT